MAKPTPLSATVALLVVAGGCAISFKDLPESSGTTSSTGARSTSTSAGGGSCAAGPSGCGGSACPAGLSSCDGVCVDEMGDVDHCGACDHACAPGQVCSNGSCCETDHAHCGGACIDTTGDPDNCGGCGIVCMGATPICKAGACAACPSGFDAIEGRCAMKYVVTTANLMGDPLYDTDYCSDPSADPFLYIQDRSVKYDSGMVTSDGSTSMTLFWTDVGPDHGFQAVHSVTLAWLPGGGRYIQTSDGCSLMTMTPGSITPKASLDGLPGLPFTVHAAEDCPAATSLSWGATTALQGAYVPGGMNTIEFVDPGASTCPPPPSCGGFSACQVTDTDALRINPEWASDAVALVTVTY